MRNVIYSNEKSRVKEVGRKTYFLFFFSTHTSRVYKIRLIYFYVVLWISLLVTLGSEPKINRVGGVTVNFFCPPPPRVDLGMLQHC